MALLLLTTHNAKTKAFLNFAPIVVHHSTAWIRRYWIAHVSAPHVVSPPCPSFCTAKHHRWITITAAAAAAALGITTFYSATTTTQRGRQTTQCEEHTMASLSSHCLPASSFLHTTPPPPPPHSHPQPTIDLLQEVNDVSEETQQPLSPHKARAIIAAIRYGQRLSAESLAWLLDAAAAQLLQEPTVLDLTTTKKRRGNVNNNNNPNDNNENENENENEVIISVVGDLHGSLPCLHQVLQLVNYWIRNDDDNDGNDNTDKEHNDEDDISNKDEDATTTTQDHNDWTRLHGTQRQRQPKRRILVFNGDFVDRGEHGVEVLVTLLLLKLAYPQHVYLLRGNHEDARVAYTYGFFDEVLHKYPHYCPCGGDDDSSLLLWDQFCQVFANLPLCAKTDTALIVHGGVPSADFDLHQLEQLTSAQRSQMYTLVDEEPTSEIEQMVTDLLWSDPDHDHQKTDKNNSMQLTANHTRGIGKTFGRGVARQVLQRHQLQYLVRAHQVAPLGVQAMTCGSSSLESGGGGGDGDSQNNDMEIVTVFSSAAYGDGGDNLGAIVHLNSNGTYQTESFSLEQAMENHQQQQHVQRLQRTHTSKPPLSPQDEIVLEDRIRSFIQSHKMNLIAAFQPVADANGLVNVAQLRRIMAETLHNHHLNTGNTTTSATDSKDHVDVLSYWNVFQRTWAPVIITQDNEKGQDDERMIHYPSFLDDPYNSVVQHPFGKKTTSNDDDGKSLLPPLDDAIIDSDQRKILRRNYDTLLAIFKYLDIVDRGDGRVHPDDFRLGVSVLNHRLPQESRLNIHHADRLFRALDIKGKGVLDMDELEQLFTII